MVYELLFVIPERNLQRTKNGEKWKQIKIIKVETTEKKKWKQIENMEKHMQIEFVPETKSHSYNLILSKMN